MSVRLPLLLLLASIAAPVSGQGSRTRPPSLHDVLARAGRYEVAYGENLATVLADEHYTQRLVWRDTRQPFQQRVLRSELAFVRLVDSTEWLGFRNVLSADGTAIRESEGRLERLLRNAPDSLVEQARLIAGDSARYNLGPITREINMPTTVLHFVHPSRQSRIRFGKEREDVLNGEPTWIIRFEEEDRGGLITRGDGKQLPASGRLWIVPEDGRVVQSELEVKNFVRGRGNSKARIDVTWAKDGRLALWGPAEMREYYEGPWQMMRTPARPAAYVIDGVATYSNYRRFSVEVRIK